LLLFVLWLLFPVLWFQAYRITTTGDVRDSFNYLGGLISAYGVIVTYWIYHNIRIYRKKGPRKAARLVLCESTHDMLGHAISLRTDLQAGQEIIVDMVGDQKVFIQNVENQNAGEKTEYVGTPTL